jgi:riboflavin biosynthesis pyrimidine reductase
MGPLPSKTVRRAGRPGQQGLVRDLRSLADVLLVGPGTMQAEGYGPARLSDKGRARRRAWGLPPVPPIAVITRSCRLDWSARCFTEAEQRPLVVTWQRRPPLIERGPPRWPT